MGILGAGTSGKRNGNVGDRQGSAPHCPIEIPGNKDIRDGDAGDNRAVGDRQVASAQSPQVPGQRGCHHVHP